MKIVYKLEFFFMVDQLNCKLVIKFMFISLVMGCYQRTLDCLPLSHTLTLWVSRTHWLAMVSFRKLTN